MSKICIVIDASVLPRSIYMAMQLVVSSLAEQRYIQAILLVESALSDGPYLTSLDRKYSGEDRIKTSPATSLSEFNALLLDIYNFALLESFERVYASQSTSFTRFWNCLSP
jgi:hypothetical protein